MMLVSKFNWFVSNTLYLYFIKYIDAMNVDDKIVFINIHFRIYIIYNIIIILKIEKDLDI